MAPKILSPYVARSLHEVYVSAVPRTQHSICQDICDYYNKYNETNDEQDLLTLYNVLEEVFDNSVFYSFFQGDNNDDMLNQMFSWIACAIIRKYSNIEEKNDLDEENDLHEDDLNYEYDEEDDECY